MATQGMHLQRVFERVELAGLKLNKGKYILRQNELNFLGHIVDARGIRLDRGKKWKLQMSHHTDVGELKRVHSRSVHSRSTSV